LIFAASARSSRFFSLSLTTVASGYWTETNLCEIGKFFATFAKTLQYSYLFASCRR